MPCVHARMVAINNIIFHITTNLSVQSGLSCTQTNSHDIANVSKNSSSYPYPAELQSSFIDWPIDFAGSVV